jgi:hypothetical protein
MNVVALTTRATSPATKSAVTTRLNERCEHRLRCPALRVSTSLALDYAALMGPLEQPCKRCDASEAWLLRPVQKLQGTLRIEAGNSTYEMLGWYEATVCCGCGHTLFVAREYQPERAIVDGEPCPACETTAAWIVDPVLDAVDWRHASPMQVRLGLKVRKLSTLFSRIAWKATLGVRICRSCGLASWTYRPDPLHGDAATCEASPRACRRCSGAQRLATVLDDLGQGRDVAERRIVPSQFRSRGRFVVDACEPCATVDWYGEGLDELEVDEKRGVFRVARRAETNGNGGPYR